jgi:pyruvate/2-oxoglutarate dehydrogenase complex dihydrolipoamide dehydrogenase (E3) component
MNKYDAIIIGSGQAGNPLARKLAGAGWKTALVERKWVGGTCVNSGCTPSKTLIASGRIAWLSGRSGEYGIHSAGFSPDIEAIMRRKNAQVLASREGLTKGLKSTHNLDLVFGNAAFSGMKEVKVTEEDGTVDVLTAGTIFLNTGAKPVLPKITGLDTIPYLTSTTIMDLSAIPEHLVIIGGSYIALEFGQLFRRLGSAVTILEGHEEFLRKEDGDISKEIRTILEEDGISIHTAVKVHEVGSEKSPEKAREGQILVQAEVEMAGKVPGGKEARNEIFRGSHLLVATGRMGESAGLNLAATGIQADDAGFIKVNGRLETNVAGIYALGDIKGGPQFTHISYNDHLIVARNLLENAGLTTEGRPEVYCLFTDPELGRIGLTEREAREKGLEIHVATMQASNIARASENSEGRGLLKAIVDANNKKIIGAAMLCPGGGELMSILQMAMMGGVTYDRIRDSVFAHPTFAESLNNLFARL